MTPRALDSLFRLATAHAKARLAKTVSKKDAVEAERIVKFALFKKVEEKRHKKIKVAVSVSSDEEDDDADDDDLSNDRVNGNRTPPNNTDQTEPEGLTNTDQTEPEGLTSDR